MYTFLRLKFVEKTQEEVGKQKITSLVSHVPKDYSKSRAEQGFIFRFWPFILHATAVFYVVSFSETKTAKSSFFPVRCSILHLSDTDVPRHTSSNCGLCTLTVFHFRLEYIDAYIRSDGVKTPGDKPALPGSSRESSSYHLACNIFLCEILVKK